MILFLPLFLLIMAFAIYLIFRAGFVLSERLRMIDLIFASDDWHRLLSIRDRISYDHMMRHFWVYPIASM